MEKLTDKLFTNRYVEDTGHPHIQIGDQDVCRDRCSGKYCTYFCPAGVYEWDEEKKLNLVSFGNCVECGACAIGCPYDNIICVTPKGGLIVPGDSTTNAHRDLIVSLAAQQRLPAVYTNRFFVTTGGLMSYGVEWTHEFEQVAFYVDRILRGAKPSDLPVQAATKFITVLNVKAAKALGLTVPPALLVAADEVIE